jgi:hypothetical protein
MESNKILELVESCVPKILEQRLLKFPDELLLLNLLFRIEASSSCHSRPETSIFDGSVLSGAKRGLHSNFTSPRKS